MGVYSEDGNGCWWGGSISSCTLSGEPKSLVLSIAVGSGLGHTRGSDRTMDC